MNDVNTLEEKLNKIKESFHQIESEHLFDNPKIVLEKFKIIKNLLGDVLNEVDKIKENATVKKQNLLIAESTPVLADNLAGNTDFKNGPPKIAGKEEVKEKGLLSDDLDMLVKRMYEGKLKFNGKKYEESIQGRQEYLAKSFMQGGVTGLLASLNKMPGLKTTQSMGEILGSFAKDSKLITAVNKGLKEKEIVFSSEHKLWRRIKFVRKEQKKREGASFMGTAGRLIAGRIVNNFFDTIKTSVHNVTTGVKAYAASTKIGRQLINTTTNVASGVKGTVSFTTKAFKIGYDTIGIGGKAIGAAANSIIPAAAVLVLSGGSVPLAVGYFGVSAGMKTYIKILDDRNLSSIKFIREAQIKYGRNLFKLDSLDVANKNGLLRANLKGFSNDQLLIGERLQAQKILGRLDSRFYRVLGNIDAVSSWAPIGAAFASLLGISPVIGGLVAGLGAVGLKAIDNAMKGGKLSLEAAMGTLPKTSSYRLLAEIPGAEFIGQYQTNAWIGMQIDLIKRKYHGNVGNYLRENWDPFKDSNIFRIANVLTNYMELGGIGASIVTGTMGRFLVGSLLPKIGLTGSIALGARGVTVAGILGSAIGITVAMLLGVPLGPMMLLGATIGTTIGTIAGLVISTSIPVVGWVGGFFITTGTTALLTGIGGWIGSFFDKALGISGSMMTNLLQGMFALVQMLALLQQRISFGNIMPIAIGLISLMATLYRMSIFDTANQCLEDNYCPTPTDEVGLNNQPELFELKAFGVYLISPQGAQVDSDILGMVTEYLGKNGTDLQNKFNNKKIFINLVGSESFVDDEFVILGLNANAGYSNEGIINSLDKSINDSITAYKSSEIDYAFLNTK